MGLPAVGDLVAYSPHDPDYDVRRIISLLVAGLRRQPLEGGAAPTSGTGWCEGRWPAG